MGNEKLKNELNREIAAKEREFDEVRGQHQRRVSKQASSWFSYWHSIRKTADQSDGRGPESAAGDKLRPGQGESNTRFAIPTTLR